MLTSFKVKVSCWMKKPTAISYAILERLVKLKKLRFCLRKCRKKGSNLLRPSKKPCPQKPWILCASFSSTPPDLRYTAELQLILLHHVQPAAEIIGFRMGELRGFSRWRARYQRKRF